MSSANDAPLGSFYWFACRLSEQLEFGEAILPSHMPPASLSDLVGVVGQSLIENHCRRHAALIEAYRDDEIVKLLSLGQLISPPERREALRKFISDRVLDRLCLRVAETADRRYDGYSPRRGRAFRPRRWTQASVIAGTFLIDDGGNCAATARKLNDGMERGAKGLTSHHVRNAERTIFGLRPRTVDGLKKRATIWALRARVARALWLKLPQRAPMPGRRLEDLTEALLENGDLLRWHDEIFDAEPVPRLIWQRLAPAARAILTSEERQAVRRSVVAAFPSAANRL